MCGDESAEKLAHEVACELGHATSDGMQASFLSGHDAHTLHYKVNTIKPWKDQKLAASSNLNKKPE